MTGDVSRDTDVEARGRGARRRAGAAEADPELEALLVLKLLPGVGDVTLETLLTAFGGSPRRALAARPGTFAEVAGWDAARARRDPALGERARASLALCRRLGIRVVRRGAPGYPDVMEQIHDPPAVLFFRGRESLLAGPGVAVVGSRRATQAGRRMSARLGAALGRAGAVVVSGLALGIDGAAHRGCLDAGGATLAVLGCGPDLPHPPSNRGLFRRIAREGLLVSEFVPGEPAFPHNFPRRNRILAALARAVVVVQAAERSGALITVSHALDLGREVFAVPGSVETRQSRGANRLIRDGARILTDPEQLVEELPFLPVEGRPGKAAAAGPPPPSRVGRDGAAVWTALGPAPVGVDELARSVGLPPPRVLAALSALEVEGWAHRSPGMRFLRGRGEGP